MKHCLRRALLCHASREALVGVPWGNDASRPLLLPAWVRHSLSGHRENAGAGLFERYLDNMGTLGIPAGLLQSGWLCQQGSLTLGILGKEQVFGQQLWVQADSRIFVQAKGGGRRGRADIFFYEGNALVEGYAGCCFPSILNATPLLSL